MEINEQYFFNYFNELSNKCASMDPSKLLAVADLIKKTATAGGKVILAGNGGSAAMASHVAVDLVKAASIRAINFNEADLITCLANDFGYEHWMQKAIEYYANPFDLIILISSSGNSKNIINAAKYSRDNNLNLITLSGFSSNNLLKDLGVINLWVDSHSYNVVELTHQTWLLSVVDFIINANKSKKH